MDKAARTDKHHRFSIAPADRWCAAILTAATFFGAAVAVSTASVHRRELAASGVASGVAHVAAAGAVGAYFVCVISLAAIACWYAVAMCAVGCTLFAGAIYGGWHACICACAKRLGIATSGSIDAIEKQN